MAHAVILLQFFLILSSALLAAYSFAVGRRDRLPIAARAVRLQLVLLSLLSLDFALFYVGTNLLSANPADASGRGLYSPASPVTFALNALLSAGVPLFGFLMLSTLARLPGGEAKGRLGVLARTAAWAAAGWLLAIDSAVLAAGILGMPYRGLIAFRDAVTAGVLFPMAMLACVLGIVYWLRARPRVGDPALRSFGDAILAAFVLLLASVLAGGSLVSLGILGGDAGLAWPILIQGPMLPGLLMDVAMASLFLRIRPAASETGPRRALAAVEAEGMPEGFFAHYRLTPREREVCSLVAQGLANKDICRMLGLSHGTIKNHVSCIFAKVGISSRFELLARLRDYRPE